MNLCEYTADVIEDLLRLVRDGATQIGIFARSLDGVVAALAAEPVCALRYYDADVLAGTIFVHGHARSAIRPLTMDAIRHRRVDGPVETRLDRYAPQRGGETTMYVPQHFREDRTDVLHDLIETYSLATVVSGNAELVADHVPLLVDRTRGPLGTLRGHFARANGHWRALAGAPALAIFQGPHAYISPTWYETPVSVPTWNYVAVHAYGTPRLIEDGAMLRELIADIVRTYEARFERPWSMDQLPAETVDRSMAQIVGFEIPIERLEGKWKMNQNRSAADRRGAIRGLRAQGSAPEAQVAELMEAALDAAPA